MSEDLEARLRAALRAVTPDDDFTQNLIARVTADQYSHSSAVGAGTRRPRASTWWLSAGMAASLLLALGVQHHVQERRERERGMEARRQVIEALRVTRQKLNLAYEAMESQSSSLTGGKPGV
jgi:hypothetical protein